MTQGLTGTFAINGTTIQMPTEHNWVERTLLGVSGNANPTYPSVRSYELRYNLMSMSDFQQLQNAFVACGATGSCVVDLPKHSVSPYQFYSYSGCVLREPTGGTFFQSYVEDVLLVVTKVRT